VRGRRRRRVVRPGAGLGCDRERREWDRDRQTGRRRREERAFFDKQRMNVGR